MDYLLADDDDDKSDADALGADSNAAADAVCGSFGDDDGDDDEIE